MPTGPPTRPRWPGLARSETATIPCDPPLARCGRAPYARTAPGSIGVARDDLAAVLGAQGPPGHQIDRILDEPHAAVAECHVHASTVITPRRVELALGAG